jgi:hypothetical protein
MPENNKTFNIDNVGWEMPNDLRYKSPAEQVAFLKKWQHIWAPKLKNKYELLDILKRPYDDVVKQCFIDCCQHQMMRLIPSFEAYCGLHAQFPDPYFLKMYTAAYRYYYQRIALGASLIAFLVAVLPFVLCVIMSDADLLIALPTALGVVAIMLSALAAWFYQKTYRFPYVFYSAFASNESVKMDAEEEYFAAIGMQGRHSFFMIGTIQNGGIKLLYRVGKAIHFDLCGVLTMDEGVEKNPANPHDLSYIAYTISAEQVNKFKVEIADHLGILCSNYPKNTEAVLIKAQSMALNNTCRHTAMDFLCVVRGEESRLVSSIFFRDLPLKTVVEHRCPTSTIPFYILPQSPQHFVQNTDILWLKNKHFVLNRIYGEMEDMILNQPRDERSWRAFQQKKIQYSQLANTENEKAFVALSPQVVIPGVKGFFERMKDSIIPRVECAHAPCPGAA